ncbi:MAG: hypothetical protein AB1330_01895 [Bacillota bacterium]
MEILRIIRRKPTTESFIEVVLAEVRSCLTPFVTWLYNKKTGGYALGHYFTSLGDAEADFWRRS